MDGREHDRQIEAARANVCALLAEEATCFVRWKTAVRCVADAQRQLGSAVGEARRAKLKSAVSGEESDAR